MKENRKRYQCPNCGWTSSEELEKEHLEHCPNCLSGIHETDREGNPCGGILEPVSVWIRENDQWEIISRCSFCGEMISARMNERDNLIKVLSIASKPLSSPPFPVERIEELTRMMGGHGEIGGKFHEQRK